MDRDELNSSPSGASVDSSAAGMDETTGQGSWFGRYGPWLLVAIIVAVLLRYYVHVTLSGVYAVALIALGLGAIIFIHELGHFAVAKWCDVHVQTFSIGFGPALPGCRWQYGETTYMIALLPLGGYVKMVGEGPDSEETENDPRSFKNKPVWQRMAIISAGVIMNMITGFALFVFVYMAHGEDRTPSIVGRIEVGSPAWQIGLRPPDKIVQIGDNADPYFDTLKSTVATSGDRPLKLVYDAPNKPPVTTEVTPHQPPGALSPLIGVGPPSELKLPPVRYKELFDGVPVQPGSAAAGATPPFEFGDQVVATTDPSDPKQVTKLPPDEWHPDQPSYYAFHQRMKKLAGQTVTVRVRRGEPGHTQEVDITVPPAFYARIGLRMRIGRIVGLRDDSPAAKAGVKQGDIITEVEINDPTKPGRTIRYVTEKHDGKPANKNVEERELDPVRLLYDLEQWAAQTRESAPAVNLIVLRDRPPPDAANHDHSAQMKVHLRVPWQKTSPQGLGLAYDVENTVASVVPNSPAARQGLRPLDHITAVGFYKPGKYQEGQEPQPLEAPTKLTAIPADRPNQWAAIFDDLQRAPGKKIVLKVERLEDPVTLEAMDSAPGSIYGAWPMAERGFYFQPDLQSWKAQSFGEALGMGTQRTYDFVAQILGNLRAVISDRLSPKNFGGPVKIAEVAYSTAQQDIWTFLIFMAIISVNLAVMNFLPIPLLDGGHMVFLIYEAIFRRPASEKVLTYATFIGLTLLLALMGYVTWFDIVGRTPSVGFVTGLYLGL